jgi:hypothetical protein
MLSNERPSNNTYLRRTLYSRGIELEITVLQRKKESDMINYRTLLNLEFLFGELSYI